ncbi:MAG: hypothetical protein EA397_00525 [Deltaproteobacteria bacterium]|nr:MAG: hypothetical protein EA397_00525 [Deltaproteobacteria bacterium]
MTSWVMIGCNPCDGHGELDVEIGTGDRSFEPLDPGHPELRMVMGLQGGAHFDLAFRLVGQRAREMVHFVAAGYVVDEEIASMDAQRMMTCHRQTGAVEANAMLFLRIDDLSGLHGETLDLHVEVETPDGRTVTKDLQAAIRAH